MSLQSLFFPLLLVALAVPLFLQARKQKRAMQEQQKLQKSITEGDRVMTTSGLLGTVVSSTDEHIDLEIADGITTTWVRAAIREKVNTESNETSEATEAEEAEPDSGTAEPKASEAKVAEPIEQQKTTS